MSITDLAVNLRDIDPESITSVQVPSTAETIYPGGEEISIVRTHEGAEQAAADALWDALQNDTIEQWKTQYPEWVKTPGKTPTETASATTD